MILPSEEARKILERCLSATIGNDCHATLTGRAGGHLRFALGEPSAAGEASDLRLTVRVSIGRRTGSSTINQTDPDSVERAVRSAEALARLAPEDPEHVAPLGPQSPAAVGAWAESTAGAGASRRAELVAAFAREAAARGCVAAGLAETAASFTAVATSTGLSLHHRWTGASLSGSVRSADGRGSGWAAARATRVEDVDAASLGRTATRKAIESAGARPVQPGATTVVLEPAAVAELIAWVVRFLDARRTAEGRTPFARPGGAIAVGERIAAEGVTLLSDPASASAPSAPFDAEGQPIGRTTWIEGGVLRTLSTTRYWAGRAGVAHVPSPSNLIMAGGPATLDDMIRDTPRGLLVTRFWSVRPVDPQTLTLTGLTRDGLFVIEKGRIAGAARNLRFNESPLGMLARADLFGPTRLCSASAETGLAVEAPALRSHGFNFTTSSDAI